VFRACRGAGGEKKCEAVSHGKPVVRCCTAELPIGVGLAGEASDWRFVEVEESEVEGTGS
jgi:hypothetical protein